MISQRNPLARVSNPPCSPRDAGDDQVILKPRLADARRADDHRWLTFRHDPITEQAIVRV
jgi:hypothetical protein